MKLRLDVMVQTISLDLAGFTWSELMILVDHLPLFQSKIREVYHVPEKTHPAPSGAGPT
jgi:hypothetical protein